MNRGKFGRSRLFVTTDDHGYILTTVILSVAKNPDAVGDTSDFPFDPFQGCRDET
jgi:hypothetical protein